MKEFVITAGDDGKKLEKWLIREMPAVGMGLRRKYLRRGPMATAGISRISHFSNFFPSSPAAMMNSFMHQLYQTAVCDAR